ncbi:MULTISPECIES: hypothetical protein [Streptacidiphilus]|uniref:Uncharacterized protein n=1 Tax=Streptacidiphilus cavernicola TaxID=3342716 RepID=A0ABV6UWC4_9ACTN|nr:hypothetical protein [Streptacidiphilus jeojiense]
MTVVGTLRQALLAELTKASTIPVLAGLQHVDPHATWKSYDMAITRSAAHKIAADGLAVLLLLREGEAEAALTGATAPTTGRLRLHLTVDQRVTELFPGRIRA